MGGSILGSKAIYNFLKPTKKNFIFVDDYLNKNLKPQKKSLNIIISKSGNTLETISNSNILINKNDKNIFITEKKNSYLNNLEHILFGLGIGIRIPFPIVGVLRFDFGIGIMHNKIKTNSFHFGIGQKF